MLFRSDVVDKFVERAAVNGVDIFRVFDAMNDPRNLERAIKAVRKQEKHAQGAMSYTLSPVHNIDSWLDMARQIESMGADSLCIKDMAGLLKPYVAYELITKLKQTVKIPIHMQCHATTGLSTATYLKAVEAGIDNVDTAISSMSMTYGHSPTESLVAMLDATGRSTGLDIELLEEIASYFRKVRKKYAKFEGSLKGIDSRILVAQVPGGMLTNLENQLREQNASDKFDAVLEEIPKVREELGFIALVTPTSQIVGSQSVLNILSGERYQTITKETAGVLKGEYGSTPAPVNADLQARVLDGAEAITCRPADLLEPEFEKQKRELVRIAKEEGIRIANEEDDTLTYALFPQAGLKFLKNRDNPDAFEPVPVLETEEAPPVASATIDPNIYTVKVAGQAYVVRVTSGGDVTQLAASSAHATPAPTAMAAPAPLAGNVIKLLVNVGDTMAAGDVILILEAMKMEHPMRAREDGVVLEVLVAEGEQVEQGALLLVVEAPGDAPADQKSVV